MGVVTHVRQLGLQVLQILLSERSPYSLVFVQLEAHCLVLLFPNVGLGHAITHVDPDLYLGELQVRQLIAVPEHVAHVESQGLQIRLFAVSPNSLEFAQELEHVLVLFTPQFGLGHVVTQVDPER